MRVQDVRLTGIDQIEFGGVAVPKGSIAAFLANAAFLRQPGLCRDVRDAALRDIFDALPGLQAVGFFEVFEIRDPALRAFVLACS